MCKFLTYPIEIQKIFLFEQKRQTKTEDVNVFLKDHASSKVFGGFTWSETLYSLSFENKNKFREAVSLRNKTPNNYEKIIEFYRREVPSIFHSGKEVIKIDGETFII